MVILLGFLFMFGAILVLILLSMRTLEKAKENQLIQSYMVSMQSFYEMIQERIEMTRRYRHDLAKHIQTLEIMLQEDGTHEMQEYMENLKVRYYQLKHAEYCTDEVINTVISIKKQQCEEKEIPFEVEIEDGNYSLIKDIDLVAILYNLLDNAYEESERINGEKDKRGIHLYMGCENGVIRMRTENHIVPGHRIDFETEKSDKEEHGIGMTIIDYLIKTYHGKREISVNSEQNLLTIDVILNGMEKTA